MNSKLLGCCVVVAFVVCVNAVQADPNRGGRCEAEMEVIGEVKSVVVAEFEKQKLKLFDDNGDKTGEKERTFTFTIVRLTSTGAKLKLSAGDNILRENNEWAVLKQNSDDKCILEFSLLGTSKNGRLEQRSWDAEEDDGCTYAFIEEDDIGEWSIVVEPVTKIKREKPGLYTGFLKVSIVAE